MPDLNEVITRLLSLMGRSDEWRIVESVALDLRGFVTIQNKTGDQVVVPIATNDIDDLTDDPMIMRIFSAIADEVGGP